MDPATLISIASFGLNLLIGAVIIIVSFRRRDPIDETLQNYATESQLERTRCELRDELSACRAERSNKCYVEHKRVNANIADLYRENKSLVETMTNKLDALRATLSHWQNGIERQLGNTEGRINNLENKEHRS